MHERRLHTFHIPAAAAAQQHKSAPPLLSLFSRDIDTTSERDSEAAEVDV